MMAIKTSPPLLTRHDIKPQTPSPPASINKWWKCFLYQVWSVLQKTSQMANPFDRKKKKKSNPSLLLFILFCGLLVPYWIMKVVREDFCLLRSIHWFHCHNTRRRSETGVWQMACHLRQCDVGVRACACVYKILHFCLIFLILVG